MAPRSARSNSPPTRFHIDEPDARVHRRNCFPADATYPRSSVAIGERQLDGFNVAIFVSTPFFFFILRPSSPVVFAGEKHVTGDGIRSR